MRLLSIISLACLGHFSAGALSATPDHPSDWDGLKVLSQNCFSCHNPEKLKAGLDMTQREALLNGGHTGPVLLPGFAEFSYLIELLGPESDPHMPPKKQLSPEDIEAVARWIDQGLLWDESVLQTTEEMERPIVIGDLPTDYHPAFALALHPNESLLAVGIGNRLVLYDLNQEGFPVVHEKTLSHGSIRSLAWNPDGSQLAVGSFRHVQVFNGQFEEQWSINEGFAGRISSLTFSAYGGVLVIGDSVPAKLGMIHVVAAPSGLRMNHWMAHEDSIYDLHIKPGGGLLVSAGGDQQIRLWELASGKKTASLEGHLGSVLGARFHPTKNELVSVGTDKQLKLWDLDTLQSAVSMSTAKSPYTTATWSGNGEVAFTADEAGTVTRLSNFKSHSGAQSSALPDRKDIHRSNTSIQALCSDAKGEKIVVADYQGGITVLDKNGKKLGLIGITPISKESEKEVVQGTFEPVESPSFTWDILPLLSEAGCSAGACHAKPNGQNGFSLSVFNFDPATDYKEISMDQKGRRVFPSAPLESLIIRKPTMSLDHGGGHRMEEGSELHTKLIKWIQEGMVYKHPGELSLKSIKVSPESLTLQTQSTAKISVTAHYDNGYSRDVTALAEVVSNDKEFFTTQDHGEIKVLDKTGEGVVVVRFMGLVASARITVPSNNTISAEEFAKLSEVNVIDTLAHQHFRKLGILPSPLATDDEFIRRSALDAIGRLPTPQETRSFLTNKLKNKRNQWIDYLLDQPGYGDYWANKWADLLRPNPDRVGVKSVYVLDQWLREAFQKNMPYDEFVKSIILSEGANHDFGPAVIYRDKREPEELTTLFSRLFIGVRLECARCHHHPNEKWSQEDFYQFAAVFGSIKQKGAGLSPPISAGKETFYFAPGGKVKHPITDQIMTPAAFGDDLEIADKTDPRTALVDWLLEKDNPYFARAAVNRVWSGFFGRGLVDPVDDFRISNPASNDPLLDALAKEFIENDYDFKWLMRTIMRSRLYQTSQDANEHNLADTVNHSRSYRRRLPAEVLLDAVNDVTGIPDVFQGCPPGTRAIQTWSYKIDSHFMDAFARPNSSTDPPCERDESVSVVQALHIMNSDRIQAKLSDPNGKVAELASSPIATEDMITELYLATFSRYPSLKEMDVATRHFESSGIGRQEAAEDLLWALLNTPEFVFNH